MHSEIFIHREGTEIQVAYVEDQKLIEFYVEESEASSLLGNIYKARVMDVLPGMNASFVDIGLMKNAFLFINDVLSELPDPQLLQVEDADLEVESSALPPRTMAIEDHLKRGQEIIAQVSRDAKGGKNVRISMKITIPGKYLVYLPTLRHFGISHRITDEEKKKTIIEYMEKYTPPGAGFIIRTRAATRSLEELRLEMGQLIQKWETLQKKIPSLTAPHLVYSDISLTGKVLRDLIDENVERIEVDDRALKQEVEEILGKEWPDHAGMLRLVPPDEQIFEKYNMDRQLRTALGRRVALKSGAYLVIDETEAMTTIDVNTGSFVGEDNPEETAFQTNLEAACASIRQIRLRNLSGMIIIDFIDMKDPDHREKILSCIENGIKYDRVRTHLAQFSDLGLVELTRKRIRKPLSNYYRESCPACRGHGVVPTYKVLKNDILKRMRHEADEAWDGIVIQIHPRMAASLRNDESFFEAVQLQFGKKVQVESLLDVPMDTIKILPA